MSIMLKITLGGRNSRLSRAGLLFRRLPGLDLADLFVMVSLERAPVFEKSVPPRDNEALAFVPFHGANRVVVGSCIDCTHDRRLIAGYTDHSTEPKCIVSVSRVNLGLNLGQQIIIVTLKLLVRSRSSSKIKGQLCRTYHSNGNAERITGPVEIIENIADSGCAKHYNTEVKHAVEPLKSEPTRSVIKCVSQGIEASVFNTHDYFFPGGVTGADGFGVGCLGPTLVSICMIGDAGWRGPKPSCVIFLVIPFVLSWRSHERAIGADSRANANRHRQYNRWSSAKSRRPLSGAPAQFHLVTPYRPSRVGVSRHA